MAFQHGDTTSAFIKNATQDNKLISNNNKTNKRNIKYIGHRGLRGMAPENTIPAFELAGQCGLWGTECDIQVTADGEWVLMHDDTVDRMTNGIGNVSCFTLKEIQTLKIDSGSNINKYSNVRIPTLKEYLKICKNFTLIPVIEIKAAEYSQNNYDSLIKTLQETGFLETVIIISFDFNVLKEIRKRDKNIHIQYLADLTQHSIDSVLALGNAGLDVNSATKIDIDNAHNQGILVNVWTITSSKDAKPYINYGVDYVTTDIKVG